MDRDKLIDAEKALDFLDTYQYPKIKEAVHTIRETLNPVLEKVKNEKIMQDHKLKYSYKTRNPINVCQGVVEALCSIPKLYEEAADNEAKAHKETQDILHAIELLDLSEAEMVQMVKELHDIRRIRREAKDFTDITLPLYDLACKYRHIAKEFTQAMSEMQKIINQKEKRGYTPREKTELTEKFEQLKTK